VLKSGFEKRNGKNEKQNETKKKSRAKKYNETKRKNLRNKTKLKNITLVNIQYFNSIVQINLLNSINTKLGSKLHHKICIDIL
jgi:hypothetical protein